ncbi:galactokinase [Cellulomonas sp. S1-8]|uniref:galactokinase n=1 Tax=Cellulomonas sp. S1-8 TaxID=2904790 RepID=UPI002243A7A1|nr:galactokinase [Cellulomonas sp. S1-8]UZN03294.1 galactokinase [Cellulomonas sp. S1-8]
MSVTLIPAWSDEEGTQRAAALWAATFGGRPDGVWAAPGRVNIIGEHVDYNGGPCLPVALPHRTFVAMTRRDDQQVRLVSDLAPHDVWSGALAQIAPGGVRGWVAYAGGPAWALAQAGHPVGGFDAAIVSCVPLGAGLSSSAAVECAVALALDETFGLGLGADDAGRRALADACIRTEAQVAGANTGGMDQSVSLRAQADHALLLDFRDGSAQQVPLDLTTSGLELLVIDTRAPHSLDDGQYAERRATCEQAAALLGVGTLREVTDLDAALAQLPDAVMRRRVRHVVTEIARVEVCTGLVRDGRLRDVGPLLDASHASLRTDYEVTCVELDVAVEAARSAGALGARMTGGGFGGSAIALVEAGTVPAVSLAVQEAFAVRGLAEPAFLLAHAGPGGARVPRRSDES